MGHAGTLDPLATGVLLVCIGNACKRAQELQDHDKEYIATIRFGATTPSYDLEKDPDRTFPYSHITEESVRVVLPSFLGEQEQIAPLFSAKSVDGVRAYELARKLYKRQKAEISPRASLGRDDKTVISSEVEKSLFDATALETLQRSRIVISELELLEFRERPLASKETLTDGTASSRINVADTSALGLPEAVIRIACSKGTYIRAFARDLGEALDSGAHLAGLIRSRSGSYSLSDTLTLDQALSLLAP